MSEKSSTFAPDLRKPLKTRSIGTILLIRKVECASYFCRGFVEVLSRFCRGFVELLPSFCRAFAELLPSFYRAFPWVNWARERFCSNRWQSVSLTARRKSVLLTVSKRDTISLTARRKSDENWQYRSRHTDENDRDLRCLQEVVAPFSRCVYTDVHL